MIRSGHWTAFMESFPSDQYLSVGGADGFGPVLVIDGLVSGVFAVIVFTAVMAVLLDVYGEVVFAAAVLLAIWLAAQVFGPTSLLALLLIMVAAGCRIVAALTTTDLGTVMPRQLVMVLDELLTDREDQDERNRR